MAYTRRRRSNSGQQNQWGQQNYDISPNPVYGEIRRGPAPQQNRFQGPQMLPAPNYTGANRPLLDNRAPTGTYTTIINNAANKYVDYQNKKDEAQKQEDKTNQQNAAAGQALVNAYQQATRPQPVNPYASAWTNSPNNPRAPWQSRPPTGSPVTNLPPAPPTPPMSNTGVPALPPQRSAPQSRQANPNAPQMPAMSPPPMTPANTN